MFFQGAYLFSVIEKRILLRFCTGIETGSAYGIKGLKKIALNGRKAEKKL